MILNGSLISDMNILADLKGSKVKYKLHYGHSNDVLRHPHGTTPPAVKAK